MTTEKKMQYIDRHYGREKQSRQLIEEMAELTVAINKAWRSYRGELPYFDGYAAILEEMADVEIMLQQIKHLMNISDAELNKKIEAKLDRQLARISDLQADDVISGKDRCAKL